MGDRRLNVNLTGKIDFEVQSGPVGDERALRAEMGTGNAAARREWDEMGQHRREALVTLLSETLTELAGNVEAWLEGSLVAKSNEKIGIFVLFKMGNLDEQIIRLRSVNAAERQARIDDLARIASGTVAASS